MEGVHMVGSGGLRTEIPQLGPGAKAPVGSLGPTEAEAKYDISV